MGSVVSTLAPVADKPVSRMISGSTTDRLPNTGRRLQAIRIRLRPSSHNEELGDGEAEGVGEVAGAEAGAVEGEEVAGAVMAGLTVSQGVLRRSTVVQDGLLATGLG